MSREYILAIVEGEKTEKQIMDNIEMLYFSKSENRKLKILPYCNNVYELYSKLKDDEFLDVRAVVINELRKKDCYKLQYEKTVNILTKISKDDISEVYLFFDYDKHSKNSDDNILFSMIEFFDNETENGKLYISYPMVEALKHIEKSNLKNCIHFNPFDGKNYKKLVSQNTDYIQINKFNKDIWSEISIFNMEKLEKHLLDSNIFLKNKEMYNNLVNQKSIFELQKKSFNNSESIVILSAFPFFLIEYYDNKFYENILKR